MAWLDQPKATDPCISHYPTSTGAEWFDYVNLFLGVGLFEVVRRTSLFSWLSPVTISFFASLFNLFTADPL